MGFVLARIWNQKALVDVCTRDAITFPAFGANTVVARLSIDTLSVHSIAAAIVCLTFIDIKASFTVTCEECGNEKSDG